MRGRTQAVLSLESIRYEAGVQTVSSQPSLPGRSPGTRGSRGFALRIPHRGGGSVLAGLRGRTLLRQGPPRSAKGGGRPISAARRGSLPWVAHASMSAKPPRNTTPGRGATIGTHFRPSNGLASLPTALDQPPRPWEDGWLEQAFVCSFTSPWACPHVHGSQLRLTARTPLPDLAMIWLIVAALIGLIALTALVSGRIFYCKIRNSPEKRWQEQVFNSWFPRSAWEPGLKPMDQCTHNRIVSFT